MKFFEKCNIQMKATEHYFLVVWYYARHDGWSFESYWDDPNFHYQNKIEWVKCCLKVLSVWLHNRKRNFCPGRSQQVPRYNVWTTRNFVCWLNYLAFALRAERWFIDIGHGILATLLLLTINCVVTMSPLAPSQRSNARPPNVLGKQSTRILLQI